MRKNKTFKNNNHNTHAHSDTDAERQRHVQVSKQSIAAVYAPVIYEHHDLAIVPLVARPVVAK